MATEPAIRRRTGQVATAVTDVAAAPVAATNRELSGVGRQVGPPGADAAAASGVPAVALDAGGALGALGAAVAAASDTVGTAFSGEVELAVTALVGAALAGAGAVAAALGGAATAEAVGAAGGGAAGAGVCEAGGPVGPAAVDRRTTAASSRCRASLAARTCTAAALNRGTGASLPAADTSA